jgi:hypothetical protein
LRRYSKLNVDDPIFREGVIFPDLYVEKSRHTILFPIKERKVKRWEISEEKNEITMKILGVSESQEQIGR